MNTAQLGERCPFCKNKWTAGTSVCVSVISQRGWKWPVKSKPVLQEVPSMPLLILAPRPAPHFSLTAPPHPLPHLLLSVSHPSGEMPCVSSTVERKPKTRKILLKGVSQQPDINILLVCRAESKPLGICGFTRVCVSVCAWVSVYSVYCVHLYISCLIFMSLSIYSVRSDTEKDKVCLLRVFFKNHIEFIF